MPTVPLEPAPLASLGRYEIVRKLAVGGMAEVFLAKAKGPQGFSKTLVLKRILPSLAESDEFVEMFLTEARLAAQLNHPNLVQIYELGEDMGNYFIAMEYIDGPPVKALLRQLTGAGKRMPYGMSARIITSACEGLAYAHDFHHPETGEPLSLVHRDVSPDNILVSRSGTVKLVDFGIAKATAEKAAVRTQTGVIKGKITYMAPEQVRGEPLDRRVDVYALGMVLYELATGRRAFPAKDDTVQLLESVLAHDLIPIEQQNPDCPEVLRQIILRATHEDKDERYPDCRTLQGDLEAFIAQSGQTVGSAQLAELVRRAELLPPRGGTPSPVRTPYPQARVVSSNPTVDVRRVDARPPAVKPMEPVKTPRPSATRPTMAMPWTTQTVSNLMHKRPRRALLLAGVIALAAVTAGAWARLDRREAVFPAKVLTAATGIVAKARAVPADARPAEGGQHARASVVVTSNGATSLHVDGHDVRKLPAHLEALPAGVVWVELYTDQGLATRKPLNLHPGDNGTQALNLEKGQVEFRVRPYANVILDGRMLGQTPLTVSVYEGKHRIVLKNPELKRSVRMQSDVRPGELNVVKYIFE